MDRVRAQPNRAASASKSRRRNQRRDENAAPDTPPAAPPQAEPGVCAPDGVLAESRIAALMRTIESQIVPRLMLAHQGQAPGVHGRAAQAVASPPSSEDIEQLARALIDRDPEAARAAIVAARLRGHGPESLLLDWIAPASRQLGAWWTEDRCDFTQVTIGMWRAQGLLWDLMPAMRPLRGTAGGRRIALSTAPRAQHSFGVNMLSEFFRQAGWVVDCDPVETYEALVLKLQEGWFDVLGLSIGAEREMEGLASVILSLRSGSLNPDLVVLVGGSALLDKPERAAELGADGTASDGPGAVALAERLAAERFGQAGGAAH